MTRGTTRTGRSVRRSERSVHVIGDSHVSFLAGLPGLVPEMPAKAACAIPGVCVHRTGQFLAHSLATPRHRVRTMIRRALDSAAPNDRVLMVFGEIDCRRHVSPQATQQGRTIESVASDLAARYAKAARSLVGSRDLAFLAIYPTRTEFVPDDWGARGTPTEHRRAARAFNSALAREARSLDAPVIDISRSLADRRGIARDEFFMDAIHADYRAAPFAVRELARLGWVDDRSIAAAEALAAVPVPPAPVILPPPMPAGISTPDDARAALFDRAALQCRVLGARRIALYGAGQHTRDLGFEAFERHGLTIAGVIDDAPKSSRLKGVRVYSPSDPACAVDAVVVSSDSMEEALARRAAAIFGPRGVPVIRIYEWRRSA
ncbi:MAG: hypothetical protein AB7Q00_01040 [Phycisphaerales bacterium]